MSNPAVIKLSESRGKTMKRVIVEDNIGEAIHIHADSLRLDLTIDSLIELGGDLQPILRNLLLRKGLDIELLDDEFLLAIRNKLPNITSAEMISKKLLDLKVAVYFRGIKPFYVCRPILMSPAFKYLSGKKEEYLTYARNSKDKLGSESRLEELNASIRNNGFDQSKRPIVIFNRKFIIMDGQHRAACLAFIDPEQNVEVLNINLTKERLLPRLVFKIAKKLLTNLRPLSKKLYFLYFMRVRLYLSWVLGKH